MEINPFIALVRIRLLFRQQSLTIPLSESLSDSITNSNECLYIVNRQSALAIEFDKCFSNFVTRYCIDNFLISLLSFEGISFWFPLTKRCVIYRTVVNYIEDNYNNSSTSWSKPPFPPKHSKLLCISNACAVYTHF